jgi:transmembrane sensor
MDTSERRNRAVAEAADWWVQLQSNDAPRSTREQYVNWLRESPIHVAEMLRIAQVHGALKRFDRWAQIDTGSDGENDNVISLTPPNPGEFPRPNRKSPTFRVWAIAASVGFIAVATTWFQLNARGDVIVAERGERREVALNDGSTVQVDPETQLRVKFNDRIRSIWLEHGRAVFKVAKNPNRPFEVYADDTVVRAVGTAFGVDCQNGGGVVVTVAEGKVAVIRTMPNSLQPSQPDRLPLALVANQQVTISKSGPAEPVHKVDSGRALAWAEGRLVFENDSVSSVVAQFNRYNHVQIHVTDAALSARPISGVFDATDPESFIAFFQSVAAVRIDRGEGHIDISPR